MKWFKVSFGRDNEETPEVKLKSERGDTSRIPEPDKASGHTSNDDAVACVNLPWRGNGIYLEDSAKATKAVCSDPDVAKMLADCVEYYSSLNAFEGSKTKAYAKFIQDAYYLYVAMTNAKIPVTSVETAFVQKAFTAFAESLQ